tara:strand:- start:2415 stop:3500 length:1086 start_codon:yes stop_codon:yes gene_type:complete
MSIKKDKYFINLANTIAKNSAWLTRFNPSVGAVIVKDDDVISFASTSIRGRPHAEINALKILSKKEKKGSTIYISLEPCAHYGKTPPCVNKIISSNIKKVVYSINDVDLRTSGKSYNILKSNNIHVKKNFYPSLTKKLYKEYFYSRKKNKPYVYGKLAISKDFYLKDKKNFYITNKYSLKTTHILRSRNSCIITTAKTINDDNPKLNCRIVGLKKYSPNVAIIDKNLKINKNSFLIKNAKKNKTFLFYNNFNKHKLKYLRSKKLILVKTPLKNINLDFNFILKKLYKFGHFNVLVEGGKNFTFNLLNNGFFNEFYLFVASQSLKNRGLIKVKNIKSKLTNKFKNIKINQTFLDKDNLIQYY